VDEIEWHMKHGFDNFCSNESDVNGDPENLLAICHEIIRRKLKLRFSGQLRIDRRSDLDFFKTLKAAGFTQLTFGVDGWTDNILYRQRKGYRIATVDQNLADARKAGLVVCVNMVVGAPGETDEDVEEAIRNVIRNKAYIWQFSTINMMRLVTNSRFYNDPDKYHIRFRGDKDQIYAVNHFRIPEELWYSENPYIDHHIRAQRYEYIRSELAKNGIRVGDYARFANTREVRRIRDAEPPAAEAPQSEPSRSVLAV
jgi:radical SAM superfamily enzyme YgiQ (UPF0313 family)